MLIIIYSGVVVGLVHKKHIINEIENKHVQRTCVWCATQLANLSFNHSIGRAHSWRFSTFYKNRNLLYVDFWQYIYQVLIIKPKTKTKWILKTYTYSSSTQSQKKLPLTANSRATSSNSCRLCRTSDYISLTTLFIYVSSRNSSVSRKRKVMVVEKTYFEVIISFENRE